MPTSEYTVELYPKFGVSAYHEEGIFGKGVSLYVIDTGLSNTSGLPDTVKLRTLPNAMESKKTHGSFVSSIVGSKKGICPEAQIYLADVGKQGKIYTSYLVTSILDAVSLHVDIISISMGTNTYSEDLEKAVKKANDEGILVFAATGNCACRTYEFPAACEQSISVASVDKNKNISAFNTRNDAVTLFAPGENIRVPGSGVLSGSSFAVPFASGLATLVLSKKRKDVPGFRYDRQSMIDVLRDENHLGLTCDKHNFSRSTCQVAGTHPGSFQEPPESNKHYLLIVCLFSIFLISNYFLPGQSCS